MSVGYVLHVLQRRWGADDGHTEEAISAILAHEALDHDLLTITASDISTYKWSSQSILLTEVATSELKTACGWCQGRYFVATLNGRRLVAGALWTRGSAVATDFPVIYIDGGPERVSLAVQPGPTTRVDLPEVHDYFKSLGKLDE